MSETIDLCRALIECASITPEDAGCQEILASRLEKIGFDCIIEPCEDVTNLWAQSGKGKPRLCYAGHTDVVPPGDEKSWHTDPFIPTIKDGYLYGRGIADMKGSVACIIVALENIAKTHGREALTGMSLLITSDEEGPAKYGTKVVLEKLHSQDKLPAYCLVGEPSCESQLGDTVKVGRRGSLHGTLTVIGKQGHVAYPEKVNNPIHNANHALSALTKAKWDEGNEHFVPTHIQITQIHSGTGALNVVPPSLVAQFNLRFAPVSSPDSIAKQAKAILDEHLEQYDLTWELGGKPFYTAPQDNPLCATLLQSINIVTGLSANCKTTGGTSDGRYFAPYKIPVVEFGPINKTIHQVNECSSIDELEQLTKIFEHCVYSFLNN